jgi:uncharacterized protein Yka (UPF0111/DUF47 family)
MAEKDISLDQAKAENWVKDVRNEITAVRTLLTTLDKDLMATPEEKDTIMKGIQETSQALESHWNKMLEGFDQAGDKINEAIRNIFQKVQEVKADLDNKRGNIGK